MSSLDAVKRSIFIDYRGGGFCVFQSYKSVEKDLEKGIGEIGILANYFSKRLTPKIIC